MQGLTFAIVSDLFQNIYPPVTPLTYHYARMFSAFRTISSRQTDYIKYGVHDPLQGIKSGLGRNHRFGFLTFLRGYSCEIVLIHNVLPADGGMLHILFTVC